MTAGPRLPMRVETRLGEAELRPLRWWQLAAVCRLERRLFPSDAWSDAMFWSELAEVDSRWYIAAWRPTGRITDDQGPNNQGPDNQGDDGADDPAGYELVGYAGLLAVRPELVDGPQDASVQTIGVAPGLRRAGLGRILLRALLAEAVARDSRAVFLEVRVDNEPAQALYRAHGFAGIGIRRGYYQPEGVDALVMRLDEPATALDVVRNSDERNDT